MLFLSYFPLSRYLQYTPVSESRKCFLVEYPAIEYTILISWIVTMILFNNHKGLQRTANEYAEDINLTLGLLPPRRHAEWRDSVGVEGSRSELKSECADIFTRIFSGCYAILTSPKEGETAAYGYNPAVFWVLSVSCWCLAELIFTKYDQHCSILRAEFNMSPVQ